MTFQIAVIASKVDPASFNIAQKMIELADWEDRRGYLTCQNHRLVLLQEELITLRGLEERLADMDLRPNLLVFASRHQARDGKPRLCGHFTGNSGEALMGGDPRRLAMAAPGVLKSFILNLLDDSSHGFEISAEATHHGPTDLTTPSIFVEIGSTEEEWSDPVAGDAVARSILELENLQTPVFLGFGGGHYVQRQNRLIRETGVSFGHMFSNYQMDDLDLDLVEQAQLKSGATFAYLDKKSLRSADKRKLSEILEELEIEALNGKEIRDRFPLAD